MYGDGDEVIIQNGMSRAGHVECVDSVNVCTATAAKPEGRRPFGFAVDVRAVCSRREGSLD